MAEEDKSTEAPTETPQGNPAVYAPKVIDPVEDTKPATQEQLAEVQKDLSAFEKATLRWMRTTAGIGLVTAVFICLQWCEMRSSGIDTHDLAVATRKQADRTKDLADRMKDQSDQMRVLAGAAKNSADTAAHQLDVTERPWLSLELMKITSVLISKDGVSIGLDLRLKNIGKSPAQQTQFQFDVSPDFRDGAEPICGRVTHGPVPSAFKHLGVLLYPNQEWNVSTAAGMQGSRFSSIRQPDGKINTSFRIVGCVAYKSEIVRGWFTTIGAYQILTAKPEWLHVLVPTVPDSYVSVPVDAFSVVGDPLSNYTKQQQK